MAAPPDGARDAGGAAPVTDAQLRGMLLDCLKLWEVEGKIVVGDSDLAIQTEAGVFTVARADADMRPMRWFYQSPERAAAGRPARAAPSVVALLSGLRSAMEGAGGDRPRIGGG